MSAVRAYDSLISYDRFVRTAARRRGEVSMDSAESSTPKVGKRHRRMPINSAVLMLRGDESWTSELMDISATGVLVRRPFDWIGQKGDRFVLDMLFGDELNIHVEARVARVADDEVDDMCREIFTKLLAEMKADPSNAEAASAFMLINSKLERIGDQATNISEEVIFTVTGDSVRHKPISFD